MCVICKRAEKQWESLVNKAAHMLRLEHFNKEVACFFPPFFV